MQHKYLIPTLVILSMPSIILWCLFAMGEHSALSAYFGLSILLPALAFSSILLLIVFVLGIKLAIAKRWQLVKVTSLYLLAVIFTMVTSLASNINLRWLSVGLSILITLSSIVWLIKIVFSPLETDVIEKDAAI